ncbi:MAG: CBS domain-containing protein [Geminicoccaceae bacterium]
MNVGQIMTSDVQLANPEMTLRDAAVLMRDGNFGLLPVGENDRLVGTISDRDIAIRAVADGQDPDRMSVRAVMSDGVLYCYEDQSVEEAAEAMSEAQVRRLPVLNRDKRLVGIVALADLATRAQPDGAAGQALDGISER